MTNLAESHPNPKNLAEFEIVWLRNYRFGYLAEFWLNLGIWMIVAKKLDEFSNYIKISCNLLKLIFFQILFPCLYTENCPLFLQAAVIELQERFFHLKAAKKNIFCACIWIF